MKLAVVSDIWRLVRELDLEAIRVAARRPFRMLLLAEEAGLAHDLAAALSADRPHPWLRCVVPGTSATPPAAGEPGPELALVLVAGEDESPALRAATAELVARGLKVVVCAVGASSRHAEAVRGAETTRVAVADTLPPSLEKLAAALADTLEGERRVAFARELPLLRDAVARRLIDDTARANATYAFTAGIAENVPLLGVPLTMADIVVLTKNQLMMAYRIALACGKDGAATDVLGELFSVIGGGFLFRQASRQLVGLIPIAGLPAKVAVAYAGTVAIGRAAATWAQRGGAISPSALRGYYREARDRGKAYFRDLRAARRPAPTA